MSFSTVWKFENLTERFVKEQKIINNFLRYRKYVTKLGEFFGYPNCCIRFYINCWKEHVSNPLRWNEREPNYVFYSYLNTKNKNKINFLLNNLSVYRLISHFPCSYNCRESLNFAAKLFKNLPEEQKRLAEKALKRDILVWNEEKMIGFKERFKGDTIIYNPKKINLLGISKKMSDALKKGNKLENSENYIKIFWDDELIFEHKKKSPEECFILSFH